MKKFLNDLQKELKKLRMSDQEIEEILADHREMIEEALQQGLTEEELNTKFGDPAKLAQEMHADTQKVRVNMNEYVQNTSYQPIKDYSLLKALPALDFNEVQVKLISEDLVMYPYDGESIEVHYKKHIKEENYEVTLENGVFTLKRNSKRTGLFERESTPDFVVRYPNKGQLNTYSVEVVSGDSELQGVNAKVVRLKSTSGDFEIQGLIAEDVDFATVSGDYEVQNAQANEVKMGAVSGDYECKNFEIKGFLDMNTVSGDFEFFNMSANEANFKTVSGDLDANEFYVNSIDLKSVSGDITIHNQDKTRPITVGKKKSLSGDINIY